MTTMNWVFKRSTLERLLLNMLYIGEGALKTTESNNGGVVYYITLRSSLCPRVFYEILWVTGASANELEDVIINCALQEEDSVYKRLCLIANDTFYEMSPATYRELSLALHLIICSVSRHATNDKMNDENATTNMTLDDVVALRNEVEELLVAGEAQLEDTALAYARDREAVQAAFGGLMLGRPVSDITF